MRVLVVGAGGQVGRRLCALAARRSHEVFGTYLARPPTLPEDHRWALDKSDARAVATVLDGSAPELVFDTGALHQVDYCETHPEEARRVNVDGTRLLAEGAARRGARLVFVSTDYVFGEGGGRPRTEDEPTDPLSVYGATKLEGERAVLAGSPDAVVARSSVVYSWNPPGGGASRSGKSVDFGTWVVEQLRGGQPLRIVADQVASPTWADDLAEALWILATSTRSGVYHVAGASAVSRFAFATRLAAAVGLDPTAIHAVTTAELGQKARRPSDSSLDSGKLARDTGYRMPGLDESLSRFATDYRTRPS